ncbi:unnamed protein product, partial [Prorocentrum cordatum]
MWGSSYSCVFICVSQGPFTQVVGVDLSEQRLAACRTVVKKYGLQGVARLSLGDGAAWRPSAASWLDLDPPRGRGQRGRKNGGWRPPQPRLRPGPPRRRLPRRQELRRPTAAPPSSTASSWTRSARTTPRCGTCRSSPRSGAGTPWASGCRGCGGRGSSSCSPRCSRTASPCCARAGRWCTRRARSAGPRTRTWSLRCWRTSPQPRWRLCRCPSGCWAGTARSLGRTQGRPPPGPRCSKATARPGAHPATAPRASTPWCRAPAGSSSPGSSVARCERCP